MVWREMVGDQGHCAGDLPDGGRFTITDRGATLTRLDIPGVTDEVPLLWTGPTGPHAMASPGVRAAYPWVGGGRAENRRPMHGVLGEVDWRMSRISAESGGTAASWYLDHQDIADLPVRPDGLVVPNFEARLRHDFAPELNMHLQVRNISADVTAQTVGFLASLRIGDPEQVWVQGLSGCDWSGLDSIIRDTAIGDQPLAHPLSRLFEVPGPDRTKPFQIAVRDQALGRRTVLEATGVSQVFVWRPAFDDAGPEAPDDPDAAAFVTIGLLNTRRRGIRLMPGQTHLAGLRLTAQRM